MANTTGFKSRVEYEVTNGTQTTYTFPFSYLRKKFVMVSILHSDDTETSLEYGVDYTINDLSVSLTTPAQVGEHLIIYRQTTTDKIITWNDGSILLARDMNTEDAQMLHLQEEQQDYITAHAIATKVTSDKEVIWDALNHRVTNVSDPKDPQDAVTKHYMEEVQGGFVAANTNLVQEATKQANAAKASQESAKAYATQANDSERASLASANLAEAWAKSTTSPDNIADAESATGKTQSSRTWALFSKSKAQEANTSATNAKTSEQHAKTSETNAAVSETNAKSSETKAAVSETNAKTSEQHAKTSETNAAVSETNAKSSETNAKTSERAASDSASASASSASASATSATNAKASETKAKTSEQHAKTSETNAAVSETNAKSSETNAKTSERAASDSASASASSASASATSATNAKASEQHAKTSEQHAKTSETNATNSAKQAAESAAVFQDFKGATATADGTGGKVPKPLAGQQEKVLKADGTWGDGVTPRTLWEGMHSYPDNYVPADVSNVGWNKLGFCSIFYTQNKINNQPTQFGQLINIPANAVDESTQLWIEQDGSYLHSRGGNVNIRINDTPFKRYATLSDINHVERVARQGNNWVRYESGLQMCWNNNLATTTTWTFPVPFSLPPVAVSTSHPDSEYSISGFSQLSNTSCKVIDEGNAAYVCAIAMGRWK